MISAALLSCLTAMRLAIQGSEVTVPDVVGRTVSQASQLLARSELVVKVRGHRFDDSVPPDRIIAQSPAVATQLKRHGRVKVLVSLGPRRVLVPDLKGKTLRASRYLLLQRGLTPGLTTMISSDGDEEDRVMSQYPAAQHQETRSPTVNLLVSSGRRKAGYLMPNLVGEPLQEVSTTLELWGIELGEVTYQSLPGLARGRVLGHTPIAGDRLLEGASVNFEVSR
jgi:serine/threonine-protein kinase